MSMKFLNERTNWRQVFPAPENGATVEETPPCLCWLLQKDVDQYEVFLKGPHGEEVFRGRTDKNYLVPNKVLPAGKYTWDVFAMDEQGDMLTRRGEQSFYIAENPVVFLRPTAQELFDAVPAERPRHLFFARDRKKLLASRQKETETLKRNIALALQNGLPHRPRFHRDPDALPYREFFGRYRDYCDRDMVACALGYSLLGDQEAGAHARELLLTVCDWNPAGPCSLNGPWGDEIGLSNARCLPAVFDMLYGLLSENERVYAAQTVAAYARQCEERLKKINYCQNPGDSHAGRLPAYMGEAAMVLKGTGVADDETLLSWLSYALDVYGGIFPFYGAEDGGWAEGAFYATSYTRWYLPFFSAVERYTGKSFLSRPFYQRFPQFLLHFASPDFENHPFGDGYWCHPEDPEWPGFFAQNPYRLYAKRFGPPLALQRAQTLCGPEIYLLHLLDAFIPDGPPPKVHLTGEARDLQCFPLTGCASMHTCLEDVTRDYAVLCKASRYGSGSHRHADQGAFAYFYKGVALVTPSGYFGRAYGSRHHAQWTRSTRASDAILVNGCGQTYGDFADTGKIVFCKEENGVKYCEMELAGGYEELTAYVRTLALYPDGTLELTDRITAQKEVEITLPLHFLAPVVLQENFGAQVAHRGVLLNIQLVSGLTSGRVSDRFDVDLNADVPEKYRVEMPPQYHLYYTSPRQREHVITVRFSAQ